MRVSNISDTLRHILAGVIAGIALTSRVSGITDG
jgi:hypothetical protein